MTAHTQAIAECLAAMATGGTARNDVAIVASWGEDTQIYVVFRSHLVGDPDQVLGLVYDLTSHPADGPPISDVDAMAFHILTYEVVEPHHYPVTIDQHDDAIHWRIASDLDTDISALPATVSQLPSRNP